MSSESWKTKSANKGRQTGAVFSRYLKVCCFQSLASISAKTPSHGSLLSVDQQPNAVVPHPSAFTLVSENVNQLQSTCDRIGEPFVFLLLRYAF